MRKTSAENDADCIHRDSRDFLLAHARKQKSVPVPDTVWHGEDCWIIKIGGDGWSISERGMELMTLLSAREACEHVPKKAALDDSVHCIRCGKHL